MRLLRFSYQYRFCAVEAVGATFDVVAGGFASAEGADKFALDAGYDGVEVAL